MRHTSMRNCPLLLPLLVALAGMVGACGDSSSDSTGPPPAAGPAALRIISGDQQLGVAAEELPAPVVVQLLDSTNHPVPGHTVMFLVIAGGGTVSAGTGRTNSSGIVETRWTLGPTAGDPQLLQAQIVDGVTGGTLLYAIFTAIAEAPRTGLHFQVVEAGTFHTCGLTDEGQAYCWGSNGSGELGNREVSSRSTTPVPVSEGLTFARIATGLSHTCGLTLSGAAYCWGENSRGQLGDGTTNRRSVPTAVSGGMVFQEIGAGWDHTCAITAGGVAYCWGANNSGGAGGQLGDGTRTDRLVPTAVAGELTFQAIAVGGLYTCGLTPAGTAHCWGSLNGSPEAIVPTPVPGRLAFTALSAGDLHVCGLLDDGSAYCWGTNSVGELGNEVFPHSAVPVAVSGRTRFAAISAGGYHTCALTLSGALTCWGWDDSFDDSRKFNDGTSIHSPTPVPVPGGLTFVSLDEGVSHGCGVTADHVAYCWFNNDEGQLGNGTLTGSYQPVAVR